MKQAAVAFVIAGVLLVVPGRAGGCSYSTEFERDMFETLERDNIIGVFEQLHIASVPGPLLFGERSVAAVVRYWGEAPGETGGRLYGPEGYPRYGGCGGEVAGDQGDRDYGVVRSDGTVDRHRYQVITGRPETEPLTAAEERALLERFGPPTVVSVGVGTRVIAWTRVVWPMALVGMLLIAAVLAALRLRVRLAARRND